MNIKTGRSRSASSAIWPTLFLILAALGPLTACQAASEAPTPAEPTSASTATVPGFGTADRGPLTVRSGVLASQDIDDRFDRISIEQGLSESVINCIMQDRHGLIWIGTDDGLNKFNGHEFTIYRQDPDDPTSLSNSRITSLLEDESGYIWVGTYGGGLNRYDPATGAFRHYRHDPEDANSLSDDQVLALHNDQKGTIWIGTRGGGLNSLDPAHGIFTRFRHDPQDSNSLSHDNVTTILEDSSGRLWVGTAFGLNLLNRENRAFVRTFSDGNVFGSLPSDSIRATFEDEAGNLWIGTSAGLSRLNRGSTTFINYQHQSDDRNSLSNNEVNAIQQDPLGFLWVATEEGLNRLDPIRGRIERFIHDPGYPESLSSSVIKALHVDSAGGTWIGTYGGGLNRFDNLSQQFDLIRAVLDDPNGLNANGIWSIYQDASNRLWIGTDGGGLNMFNPTTQGWTHYRNDPDDPQSISHDIVVVIYPDSKGNLWLGTWGGGLNRFDPDTGVFIAYRADPEDPRSLSHDVIWSIHEDPNGQMWLGTAGGLNRFDPEAETFTRYFHNPADPDSLADNAVGPIFRDSTGTLWIATHGGLNQFDDQNDRFECFRHDADDPTSISHNIVFAIHEDPSGQLWFGTWGGGLNKFDRLSGTFEAYRTKDGLPNDVIYGILEDQSGNLWMSTNYGLSRFDPVMETFTNYDVDDGLQSNEFNYNAYFQNDQGELFFGGINGLNAFYPEQIRGNTQIPPIVLTSIKQNGPETATIDAAENISALTFRWPATDFQFEFAALNYFQWPQNQYAYMLEGFDEDWHYVGTRHFGGYTNLPGGAYTLRLKGSNNDGLWNEEGTAIAITVIPPVWGTWWFRGLAAAVIIVAIAAGYRLRIRTVKARSRELEDLIDERTRDLEERTAELEERTYEIERRRKELEALYRADEELYRDLNLDQVLEALMRTAVNILHADKGALMVWDDRRERLSVRVSHGLDPTTLEIMSFAPGQGVAGRVALSGETVIVEDTHQDPRVTRAITEPEGIRSFMQVPIEVGSQVFGVFSADYLQPRAFGDEERRLLIALAQRAALAIQNAQLYEQTQEVAVVEERSRLARELHDAVTQTLFSASLIAEVLPRLWDKDPDEAMHRLGELRDLTRGALAEMRTLLMELRPDSILETNFDELLRQLAESVTGRSRIPVRVDIRDGCELPDDVKVGLYRIVQEALNNIAKHSGASQAGLTLEGGPQNIQLTIWDDGRGFDPEAQHLESLGLGIMNERAQMIGARLHIQSQVGQGTRINVVWQEVAEGVR